MTSSADGRRVLVAVVTGELGDRIQAWRRQHDPQQAQRIPPHTTLLYWAQVAPGDELALDAQIRHAFPATIDVRLTTVRAFDNPDQTFFLEMTETAALDAARDRLFDGRHLQFAPQRQAWSWHITVVRYGKAIGQDRVLPHIGELALYTTWTIDRLLWLELHGGAYHEVGRWELG